MTEEEFLRKKYVAEYWDFYKEVYNVRPRWVNFEGCSEADLVEMLDRLNEQAQAVFAQREEDELDAVVSFENMVAMTIAAGAEDRATALRWIMDGSTCNGDWEFMCYEHGLPYGYFKVDKVAA